MSLTITHLLNGLLAFPGVSAAVPEPLPFVVQAGLPDAAELLSPFKLTVNDQPNGSVSIGGYARVRPREWKDGDHLKLTYRLGPRLIVGHFGNSDRFGA